ncbi:MAG: TIGR03032 family protein [Nocardioides sp.]|nr:TIGR03032 family protein [Nocardioidaceae bacterium]MCB8956471.1 TIGR03032 family protein [Nocardioides sp.]
MTAGADEEHAADPGTEVRYRHSTSLPGLLEAAGCSVLLSTYQAGQLAAVGVADGRLSFAFRRFDHAMGVAVDGDRIAVGGKTQVWTLREQSDIAPSIEPAGRHDRCWLPASSVVTGEIRCHELAWGTTDAGEPDLWVVNTLFSCLAGLDPRYSFVPRWRPPFISALAAEDRCHLNGLAVRDGRPAFVTVMARTDEPGGWRAARNDTGTVLDVPSGEVVTTGLSMPHSPRWYDGQLFVLNSGMGRLERVDPASGGREVVAVLPGYARGLALHDGLAFVGLSRIRETSTFGGAPIAAYHDQLVCGVGVIDLRTGDTVATLQFENGVEEIFDVQVVPGARCPTFGGPAGDADEVWVLPAP